MEKKESNLEKDNDDNEDYKYSKSKTSKKKSSIQDSDIDRDTEETKLTEKPQKRKLADFFKKPDNKDELVESEIESDEDIEKSENDNEDYEPNLTEDEVHEATLVITEARMQDISEELQGAEPDSIEEYEALSSAVFIEELQEIAEGNENITKESIDRAYREAFGDLSLEDNNKDSQNDTTENVDGANNNNLLGDIEENVENEANLDKEQLNENTINFNGDVVGQVTNVTSDSPSNSYRSIFISKSGQSNYRVNNQDREVIVEGRRSDMLVGAVIGYIIGRRGGRKRTEKKLHPKINKLEEQIYELHYEIINKEDKIRTLARQRAEEFERQKRLESNKVDINEQNNTMLDEIIERRKIKKDIKEKLKQREKLAEDPSVEKIGKISLPALKIFHERRLLDGSENSPKRKQVEVMNERELLEKIDGLLINGHSVKKLYLNGEISKDNLRQITKEYLRGGPFKETFMRVFIENKHEKNNKAMIDEYSKVDNTTNTRKEIVNENKLKTLSKEEAIKQAEALLLTNTLNKKEPTRNRLGIAMFTLLFLFVFMTIIIFLS